MLSQGGKTEYRRVQVPAHRFTPLKEKWLEIYEPIVKNMKLQVRMNLKTKSVELRVGCCTVLCCACVMVCFVTHMKLLVATSQASTPKGLRCVWALAFDLLEAAVLMLLRDMHCYAAPQL